MSDRKFQDFKPVILKKVTPKKKVNTNKQNNQRTIMTKIDNEEIKLPTVPLEMSKIIQQARTNKNLTQVDLAKKCNFPKETIRDYENGKAIIKHSELTAICRALGINLYMPKPVKVNDQTK